MVSKFEFESFVGGYDSFAVSKQKFTKEEAIKCAIYQKDWSGREGYIAIGDAFVRHRAGRNEEGEPVVGWWLEYEEHKRSCPVWCFHTTNDPANDGKWAGDYEYIPIGERREGE